MVSRKKKQMISRIIVSVIAIILSLGLLITSLTGYF